MNTLNRLGTVCVSVSQKLMRSSQLHECGIEQDLANIKYVHEYEDEKVGREVFPTRLPVHQRMNANGNWHQMIYFPKTRIQ